MLKPMRPKATTAAVLVAAATLAAYANSLGGEYVFDDVASLANNPTLRDWRLIFSPPGSGVTVAGRPVLNASFALSHWLGQGAPWGHHAINLLIHAAAGLTLFGIVRRTLELPLLAARFGSSSVGLAFFTATLWAAHPLQTESVTYMVQRAESLMGLFVLLTFYCYLRGSTPVAPGGNAAERPRPLSSHPPSPMSSWVWLGLAVASCVLGMGTKEVTVVVPVLVLLYDRTFVSGSFLAAWRTRRVVLCALFATWMPLGALVLGSGGNRGGTSGFDVGVTALGYWLTQFEAVVRYLALSVWPHPLVFEYGTFSATRFVAVLPFALPVLVLAGATLWALWRQPALGFLGLWFFAILAPTSIIPGTLQMIVEHRMYLSLAAVLVSLVLAAHCWLPRAAPWLGIGAIAACTALTIQRNNDYRTALGLWSDTLAKRPENPAALNGVGIALLAKDGPAQALPYFEKAARLGPRHAEYRANHAGALAALGRIDEAIAHYEAAINEEPRYAAAHANLGLILSDTGRLAEAIAHGEIAVRLNPGAASVHTNLGVSLLRAQRPADAALRLETALRLEPTSAEAHNSLGVALIQLGRAPEAVAHFEAALRTKPDYPQARDNLNRLKAMLAPALSR